MPRLSITDLPKASPRFRDAVRKAIETRDASGVEDAKRARLLRTTANNGSVLIDHDACLELASRLELAATSISVPDTLASKCSMRLKRLGVGSSLWALVDQDPSRATTFTLVSHRWTIPARRLPVIDPHDILNGTRSDLNRCAIDLTDGGAFLALDGEFERNRALYQLHVNGVAFGSAIQAFERLRELDKYKRVIDCSALRLPIYRPVVVRRAPLTNLPSSLSYQLKSYWPATWLPLDGATPRSRTDQRIPEPYHSQWLLWMDKWHLSDVTLLMGMFVGANGLTLTNGGTK